MIGFRVSFLPLPLLIGALVSCSDATGTSEPVGSSGSGSGGGEAGGSLGEAGDAASDGTETDELTVFDPADRTPRPSAGCGSGDATPPVGTRSFNMSDGSEGRYLVTRPPDYDPSVPQALGFVFHGANNSEADCRGSGNCLGVAQALEGEAITIYMKSFSASWTDAERDRNVDFFDELLAHAKQTYCVDERRVFALGTSSGAHFSNILACRRPNDLLAVVPGAGERLEKEGCQPGRVAALVLHGVDDVIVPFAAGEEARDFYAAQNGCSASTEPTIESMHAEVRAAREAGESAHGCVDYVGCDEGLPVRWCEHSVGGYDGSTHGWPVQGGQLTWDFVSELL